MNVLLLTLSTLRPGIEVLSAYTDNAARENYLYLSQLEPGSKYFFGKLAAAGEKLDKVIVLCTPEVMKSEKHDVSCAGKHLRTYESISSYTLYKERMTAFLSGNNDDDDLFGSLTGISPAHFASAGLYPEDDIGELFVPVDISFSGSHFTENIGKIVSKITEGAADGENIALYLDAQGGSRASVQIINTVINMLRPRNVYLKEVCAIDYEPGRKENPIMDETESYLINDLASALNAFLEYGRAELFVKYYERYKKRLISRIGGKFRGLCEDRIIKDIQSISKSITLCNVDDFTKGIGLLRKDTEDYRSAESNGKGVEKDKLFDVILDDIKNSYGALLTEEGSVSLIEQAQWCLEKKLFQQSLTLLESYTPAFLMQCGFLYYEDNEDTRRAFASLRSPGGNIPNELRDTCHFTLKNFINNRVNFGKGLDLEISRHKDKLDDLKNGNYMFTVYSPDRKRSARICLRSVLFSENSDDDSETEYFKNVLERYRDICNIRNDTNHANKGAKTDRIQNIIADFIDLLRVVRTKTDALRSPDFSFRRIDMNDIPSPAPGKEDVSGRVFVNLSNHPSGKWSTAQRAAAEKYGTITDIPFPQISPDAASDDIDRLVSEYSDKISAFDCAAVMLQGEFVFTYRLVSLLKEKNIKVLSSCSERRSSEYTDENGRTQIKSEFEFIAFREY